MQWKLLDVDLHVDAFSFVSNMVWGTGRVRINQFVWFSL